MKKCLIIINKNAGSSKRISFDKVENVLGKDYMYSHLTLPCSLIIPYDNFDAIAICGGDGTLSSIMQNVWDKKIDVYYFPVGTLNDKAKAAKHKCQSKNKCFQNNTIVIGRLFDNDLYSQQGVCNPTDNALLESSISCYKNASVENCTQVIFTYVFAAGSFTPIGYCSNVKNKKKFGIWAYIAHIIKEYKPHRITAKILVNEQKFEGEFTLIMLIKSPRCFGFSFNKAYDEKACSGHLIAIRSPKHNGALGYIEMFFPFFRTFFVGLKKPKAQGNLIFIEAEKLKIMLDNPTDFCKDGEKYSLNSGEYDITFTQTKCKFSIIDNF